MVFDVIADPYLVRTPRAFEEKLDVWERGTDMALAAHFTQTPIGKTTTVETVRFDRPTRIDFRLLRGPVPHVSESFELKPSEAGTELTWHGELGTDLWGAGRLWGAKVAAVGKQPSASRSTRSSPKQNAGRCYDRSRARCQARP